MKRVLLLDTNVSSYPIYDFLIDEGFEVYVAGSRSSDCLAKFTPNFIQFDYSDIKKLEFILLEKKIDFVVPGCNDVSYFSACKLANKINLFGLDTEENTKIINNKALFRSFAIQNGLSVPMILTREEALKTNTRIIIKPVDAYSGRGISRLQKPNLNNLEEAITEAISFSKNKDFVIEEFVKGQLCSHSAFISNGEILIDFFVKEDSSTNKYTVDTSRLDVSISKDIKRKLRKEICFIANKLNLVDGLIHTQFILTKKSFKIIEITRRCPGDLYSLLIQKSTGYDYARAYTEPFINRKNSNKKTDKKISLVIRHTISESEKIKYRSIYFNKNFELEQLVPLSTTGDTIEKSPFGRFGIMFIKCSCKSEMKNIYKKILKREIYNLI